jgi:hypothetical protein
LETGAAQHRSRERFQELAKSPSLGNVIFCSTANPVRLVQKEIAIAERVCVPKTLSGLMT